MKSQSFKQWEVAQLGRHETVNTISEHYSPTVTGSIPVRGNFFAEFINFALIQFWQNSQNDLFQENLECWDATKEEIDFLLLQSKLCSSVFNSRFVFHHTRHHLLRSVQRQDGEQQTRTRKLQVQVCCFYHVRYMWIGNICNYRLPTNLWEGNTFTCGCLSVHRGVPYDYYPWCIGPSVHATRPCTLPLLDKLLHCTGTAPVPC